tara:strand:- start:4586 stop:5353 length:768 start_codon:yes stop_codon:yes gene_type:complete
MNKPTKTEITKMKKAELVESLIKCGLSSTGQRPELQKRLVAHFYKKEVAVSKPVKVSSNEKSSKETETKEILNKSTIRLMKKGDLITRLSNLHMDTSGTRVDLVTRLENYYRPCAKDATAMKGAMDVLNIPSKTQLGKMSRDELIANLTKLNLNLEGANSTLQQRLEDYYHPVDNNPSNNDKIEKSEPKPVKPVKPVSEEIDMQVILYEGRYIGVDQETHAIYDPEDGIFKDDCNWEETDLIWCIENNKPIPYPI